jgi:tetratricopeptide (TPR) repeat protein
MSENPIAALESAEGTLRDIEREIEDVGESDVAAVANAYDDMVSLFDRYEDRATGTGDFQAFVEFQDAVAELVEGLPEDLPRRDTFEEVLDLLDKRRLSEDDFAAARETLAAVASVADLPNERSNALERYRDARQTAAHRKGDVEERIAHLERLLELGDADLDADVDPLREPVEVYNSGIREAFRTFRSEESARDVLDFAVTAEKYPLVDLDPPPSDLLDFVRESPVGEEPIPTLLEYADYSKSKLDHYVDDAAALKRQVATRQTHLERFDADPLTVNWPPPSADDLWWRSRELISLVSRFAPEAVVARLRDVRALTREDDYERLRNAAVARERLGPEERDRLASGDVADELADLREERDALADALEEYPDR